MGMNILATIYAHDWTGAKQEKPHDFRRQDLWRTNTDMGRESVLLTKNHERRCGERRWRGMMLAARDIVEATPLRKERVL